MRRAALFLLPLAACSMRFSSYSASNHQSKIGLVDFTANTRMQIDCKAEADTVVVELSVNCTAGSLHVRLVAPDGHCCLDETMRGGDRSGKLEFAPSIGIWECELEYSGFSGDTAITLCASGGTAIDLEVGSR